MSDQAAFQEIDDAVRQDDLKAWWKRWGNYVVVGAVLAVVAVAALVGWRQYDASRRAAASTAYSIGQTVCGRLVDRVGTRRGLSVTVLLYSIVSISTSLARGFYSFATFRFLLGAGESANWPAATKAVSEWFPARERGLATALFDSGSSVGGAIASWLILSIYFRWGWRPASSAIS